MARKSEYTDQDILILLDIKGLDRIKGNHRNGSSKHLVKCQSCGGVQLKRSKQIVSKNKGKCSLIPCSPRGAMTMGYLKLVAQENGARVWHPKAEKSWTDSHVISSRDIIIWKKNKAVMTQSWYEVRSRALSTKRGAFFIADKDRINPSKNLTNEEVDDICSRKSLKRLSNVTNRADKNSYKVENCGHIEDLTFTQLKKFENCLHPTCINLKRKEILNSMLAISSMRFNGELYFLEGTRQVDRSQLINIECLFCNSINQPRSYDKVHWRGFTFCDNNECKNSYDSRDVVGETKDYYVNLIKSEGITSWVEYQKKFPISFYKHIKRNSNYDYDDIGKLYRDITREVEFKENIRNSGVSYTEIENEIFFLVKNGYKTITKIENKMSEKIRSSVASRRKKGENIIPDVLDKLSIQYKKTIVIKNLEDAICIFKDRKLNSWSDVVNLAPSAAKIIQEKGLKEELFEVMGWTSLANFSKMTDSELIESASHQLKLNSISTISELEKISYGLVHNLRSRSLINEFLSNNSMKINESWDSKSVEDITDYIESEGYISITDWHKNSSGSYKVAAKNGWTLEIVRYMGWGAYIGIDQNSYKSAPEVLLADILKIAKIPYEVEPKVTDFYGKSGGRLRGDFKILDGSGSWIEVWAYNYGNKLIKKSKMRDYLKQREHKEKLYEKNGYPLVSIEGRVFYESIFIHGKRYKKGLEGLVQHIAETLEKKGYCLPSMEELVLAIREKTNNADMGLTTQKMMFS